MPRPGTAARARPDLPAGGRSWPRRSRGSKTRATRCSRRRTRSEPPPPPPPPSTNRTRLVPPPVLTGHVSSLLPYGEQGQSPPCPPSPPHPPRTHQQHQQQHRRHGHPRPTAALGGQIPSLRNEISELERKLEAEKEERRKVEHALHEVKEELWQTKQATPPPLWMSCRSGVCRILFGSSIGRVVIQPGSLRPAPARPPLTRRVTRGDR